MYYYPPVGGLMVAALCRGLSGGVSIFSGSTYQIGPLGVIILLLKR